MKRKVNDKGDGDEGKRPRRKYAGYSHSRYHTGICLSVHLYVSVYLYLCMCVCVGVCEYTSRVHDLGTVREKPKNTTRTYCSALRLSLSWDVCLCLDMYICEDVQLCVCVVSSRLSFPLGATQTSDIQCACVYIHNMYGGVCICTCV